MAARDVSASLHWEPCAFLADDVISRMCALGDLGDDEIAMMAMFMLFAGHETTVVAIGMGHCAC